MATDLRAGLRQSLKTSLKTGLVGATGTGFDAAAAAYIAAVEAADGQSLEAGVKTAINAFVVGCKADGIWDAIKASCILSGARTLSGALVPLAGTGPTNINFVSGDYDRKTGLVGNGSTKYLNSNRTTNSDPQNNKHLGIYVSTGDSKPSGFPFYSSGGGAGVVGIIRDASTNTLGFYASNVPDPLLIADQGNTTGFKGVFRNNASTISGRTGGTTTSRSSMSTAETITSNIVVFADNYLNTIGNYSNARLAFYSIGEALDLALLDARVTTIISAYAAALP
jgi:hypothetical protein